MISVKEAYKKPILTMYHKAEGSNENFFQSFLLYLYSGDSKEKEQTFENVTFHRL